MPPSCWRSSRSGASDPGRTAAAHLDLHVRPQVGHERRQGGPQCSRKAGEDIQTRIPPAPLNAADIGPMEISPLRKLFLG
jgi:hypothetical protein